MYSVCLGPTSPSAAVSTSLPLLRGGVQLCREGMLGRADVSSVHEKVLN